MQRGWSELLQQGIGFGHLVPTRLLKSRRQAVFGCDGCLGVKAREALASCRLREPFDPRQNVEDLLNGREPGGVLLLAESIEWQRPFLEAGSRACKPFAYVGFVHEQPMRDLVHVETAERLERQHSLRFNGQVLIAAHEQHSQQVILDLRF